MIPIERVVINGFAMQYFRFGTGARTLVILPGLSVQSVMGSAEAVAAAYASFAEDYTIYVFDRRETLPEAYPVQEMARVTAEAMKALGLKDRLATMTEDEQFAILATDGMLVRRPLLVTEETVIPGFKAAEYEKLLQGKETI